MGMIVGAGLIYFLQNYADSVAGWINHLPALNLDPKQPGIPSMVFGVVLIVVMVLLPTGAGGLLRRVFGPLTSRIYTRS
jgi:ABC-type branched-subunit amino acid transport system permease subunit